MKEQLLASLISGERASLWSVVKDSSLEDCASPILLSTITVIRASRKVIFDTLGQSQGKQTKI